ncbi:MAG: EamA/RhaT family transporter [Taibaiella sp.]|nr:EamA/RhaT family transporter [Taibaiella sp.]
MVYLLLVVLCNTLISIVFKLFARYKINTLQAIVVNYLVCVATGSIYLGRMAFSQQSIQAPWLPCCLLMGAAFISLFSLQAYTTKVDGITTTTIANKLSLVIPVLFSIMLYGDTAGIGKVVGILLAIPAIYLVTVVDKGSKHQHQLLWPILLFIGSGLLDTLVKYAEHNYLGTTDEQAIYTIHTFATAGAIGVVLLIVLVCLKKTKLQWRNVLAGVCVGIPNYFSIYFFIRMLHTNFLQSSATIPVNNIGTVVACTLTAILLFREKVTATRVAGLVLALLAILLIAFNGK